VDSGEKPTTHILRDKHFAIINVASNNKTG